MVKLCYLWQIVPPKKVLPRYILAMSFETSLRNEFEKGVAIRSIVFWTVRLFVDGNYRAAPFMVRYGTACRGYFDDIIPSAGSASVVGLHLLCNVQCFFTCDGLVVR
jgi:hypothetical protein